MQAETFDYCGGGSGTGMGEAFIGVSSLAIGTNGTGFNADPYTLCDLWAMRINFSVWSAQAVATIQTASEQNCQECYVSQYYPESPCFRLNVSSIDEVQYCKASGQSPTGTYENCVGLPHEFCGIDPLSCDDCPNTPPFIGITINDITVVWSNATIGRRATLTAVDAAVPGITAGARPLESASNARTAF
jgi:hypothetical protein